MVGVPGRSKACHNCRQRRIKCGGELPTCRNCTKSKRLCAGYHRQHAFILSKEMASNVLASSSSPAGTSTIHSDEYHSGTPSCARVMISRYYQKDVRPDNNTGKTSDSKTTTNKSAAVPSSRHGTQLAATTTTLSPCQEVPIHNIFRERIFAIFLDHNLPAADEASVHIPFTQRNDLMLQVLNLPDLAPALENTLLAVYLARLGRQHGLPTLVRASLSLYTRGMSAMRRDLPNQSLRYNDQNLAASLALLLYEVTECPGGTVDGYMAHYRGMLQLLKMRGPGAHASGLAHSVFHILRLHTVLPSMAYNIRSFLADPEWRELPWTPSSTTTGEKKTVPKTPFDQLIDILLDMPALGPRRQAVEAMTDPKQILAGCIANIHEGYDLEAKLSRWFENYRRTVPGALYHPRLSTIDSVVDDPEKGKLFPVAFHFPAFMVGQSMIYYWVGLMSIHAHLCFSYDTLGRLLQVLDKMGRGNLPCNCSSRSLSDSTPPPPERGAPSSVYSGSQCLQHFTISTSTTTSKSSSTERMLPPLGPRSEWPRTTAYNICQSAEYFLQDRARSFMPATVLPVLALVKGFWKHAPPGDDLGREMAWVDDMLGRINDSGSAMAGVLRRLG